MVVIRIFNDGDTYKYNIRPKRESSMTQFVTSAVNFKTPRAAMKHATLFVEEIAQHGIDPDIVYKFPKDYLKEDDEQDN